MHRTLFFRGTLLLTAFALLAGCSRPISEREKGLAKGTLVGGGLGAGTGALIGALVEGISIGTGAAVGGGIGAVAGALVAERLRGPKEDASAQQQSIEQHRQELAHNRELLEELKRQNLEARETKQGVVVNMPDVLFDFGSAGLTRPARDTVENIAGVLNDQARDRRVVIEGYTDSVGSEAFNQRLSEQRAQSVALALRNSGVDDQRITIRGYGEQYPVASNLTPGGEDNTAGREKNRRVEVVIKNQPEESVSSLERNER